MTRAGRPPTVEWTTRENLALLKQLWPTTSCGVLARRFGISKNALVGKAHRMGLTGKPSPIKRRFDPFGPPPPPVPPRDRTIPKPIGPTLPALASLEPIVAPAPHIRTRSLPVEPCCWVTTEGGRGKPWLYCDADSVPGKPFCREHARLAYQPTKQRPAEVSAMGGD